MQIYANFDKNQSSFIINFDKITNSSSITSISPKRAPIGKTIQVEKQIRRPYDLPLDLPQDYVAELLQKARIKLAGTLHYPLSFRSTIYYLAEKVRIFF